MEPTEFAIELKSSFHRFVTLLSPEVPPTVSGRDSFLELSALISFHQSLYSPCEVLIAWTDNEVDPHSLSKISFHA